MQTIEIVKRFNAKRITEVIWKTECPAHPKDGQVLCIKKGDDGRTFIYCRDGCTVDQILEPFGLQWADLFETPPPQDEIERLRANNKETCVKRVRQVARCEKATDAIKQAQSALYDLRAKLPNNVLEAFDNAIHSVAAARWTITLVRERL